MSLEDSFIPLRDELARNLYIEFCGKLLPLDYLKLPSDDKMFWITRAEKILKRLEDYGFYSREIPEDTITISRAVAQWVINNKFTIPNELYDEIKKGLGV